MKYFWTNVFQHKNKIHVWGYGNGKRFYDDIEYQPYLFVPNPEGKYRTIHGQPVVKKPFPNTYEAYKFLKEMEQVSNSKVYGLSNWVYLFINDNFPGKVDFDPSLIHIISLDIEVSSKKGLPDTQKADQEVTAITLTRNGKSITLGTKVYKPKKPENQFILCVDEKDLLYQFLCLWNGDEWYADIVTGWNIDQFDIPYLINRVCNVLGEKYVKAFSPIGVVQEKPVIRGKTSATFKFDSRVENVYEIAGITSLDYLPLYKKFAMNARESYSLAYISQYELNETKLDYSEYGTLDDLYEKNPELYFDYNIRDAFLVERLEHKLNYIRQVFAIAFRAKINFIDTLTTSRPWDAIIHSYLLERGIVIPQSNPPDYTPQFDGAYVKDPQIGLHHWVVSFDLTSLYPSIISQHNISPDTYVTKVLLPDIDTIIETSSIGITEELKRDNLTVTVNGCKFRRDKRGFIPELVDEFIAERASVKKKMLDMEKTGSEAAEVKHLNNYQNALKILTNGLYGALGMKYFRWFDVDHAAAVTATGQLAVRWIQIRLNQYLNKVLKTEGKDYVVASDTDSCYLVLDGLVEQCGMSSEQPDRIVEFLDKVCKEKLEPFIQRSYVELGEILNVYTLKMKMKREVIANKGIWRGKKMYILNVWNSEGVAYKEPKLVIHGIEAVRSSTPNICRNHIKEALKIIMNKDEAALQKYIKEFHEKFITLPFEDVAFPRSVNGLIDYYDAVHGCKKGTPIHVRGAFVFNSMLEKLELTHKYPKVIDRMKIRFAYLKTPNPSMSYVISCPEEMPSEFDMKQYIDYETQWEKTFLAPIESITNVIGWKTKKQSNLEGLFGRKL